MVLWPSVVFTGDPDEIMNVYILEDVQQKMALVHHISSTQTSPWTRTW